MKSIIDNRAPPIDLRRELLGVSASGRSSVHLLSCTLSPLALETFVPPTVLVPSGGGPGLRRKNKGSASISLEFSSIIASASASPIIERDSISSASSKI